MVFCQYLSPYLKSCSNNHRFGRYPNNYSKIKNYIRQTVQIPKLHFTRKQFRIFLFFYQRVALPALFFAVASCTLGLLVGGGFSTANLGLFFILFTPVIFFLQYYLRLKNELMFYANLGYSRSTLWILSLSTSTILGLFTMLIK